MKNSKRTILVLNLICVVFVFISSAKTVHRTNEEKRAKALELLDKFAETQDKLQSFIIKTEIENESNVSLSGEDGILNGVKKGYELGEIRFDGHRNYYRYKKWGDVGRHKIPKGDPIYTSFLFDGEQKIQNHIRNHTLNPPRPYPSFVVIRRNEYLTDRGRYDSITMGAGQSLAGYLFSDHERIDSVLSISDSISVQDKPEKIGTFDCYVIEAVVKNRGKYTIWIDPKHGYNIAKAVVKKGLGDWAFKKDYVLTGKASVFSSIRNVRFEKIDGVWIPMEANIVKNFTRPNGDFTKQKIRCKRTEIILNPDHDRLGSFLPTDIPNKAQVSVYPITNTRYIWQDGEVLDADGKVIMSFPKEQMKSMRK